MVKSGIGHMVFWPSQAMPEDLLPSRRRPEPEVRTALMRGNADLSLMEDFDVDGFSIATRLALLEAQLLEVNGRSA